MSHRKKNVQNFACTQECLLWAVLKLVNYLYSKFTQWKFSIAGNVKCFLLPVNLEAITIPRIVLWGSLVLPWNHCTIQTTVTSRAVVISSWIWINFKCTDTDHKISNSRISQSYSFTRSVPYGIHFNKWIYWTDVTMTFKFLWHRHRCHNHLPHFLQIKSMGSLHHIICRTVLITKLAISCYTFIHRLWALVA